MTSDGNPYARFRRALATGNEMLVLAAARELPQIALAMRCGSAWSSAAVMASATNGRR